MDAEQIAAIRARVAAATDGPWAVVDTTDPHDDSPVVFVGMSREPEGRWWEVDSTILDLPDAEFIAHARQDIPALLNALAASQAQVAAVEAREKKLRDALHGLTSYAVMAEHYIPEGEKANARRLIEQAQRAF